MTMAFFVQRSSAKAAEPSVKVKRSRKSSAVAGEVRANRSRPMKKLSERTLTIPAAQHFVPLERAKIVR